MVAPTARARIRPLYLILALVSALLLITASLAGAQTAPPDDPAAAAQALKASLTAEQRQAIGAALSAHGDELADLARQLSASLPLSATAENHAWLPMLIAPADASAIVNGTAETADQARVRPDAEATSATLAQLAPALQSLQAAIEAEIAAVLTPEQLALYRTALSVGAPPADSAALTATAGEATLTSVDASTCFYAATWVNYGFAYVSAAKSYAFMGAFDPLGTNTATAEGSYIAYNGSAAYALDGLKNLSTASVLITAEDPVVRSVNGSILFGVQGESQTAIAEDLNELGRDLALEDYRASGGRIVRGEPDGGSYYAYLAYYYGFYANQLFEGALEYTGACY